MFYHYLLERVTKDYNECYYVIGDYTDCCVAVWSTSSHDLLTSTKSCDSAIHHLKWDPFCCNEFASVGEDGSLLFWLLDETKAGKVTLNVHEAQMPQQQLMSVSQFQALHCQTLYSITC